RMRLQAQRFGAELHDGYVRALYKDGDGFIASTGSTSVRARAVLLATGVTNLPPSRMPSEIHDKALSRGQLRYCPVCDAYEACGQRIAVIGSRSRGLKEAEFLRAYSDNVSLVAPDGPHELGRSDRDRLLGIGVSLLDGPATHFKLTNDKIGFA